ncbi:MAG: MATE family efflux transporter, partial [Bacteroidota bacterium]
GETGLALRMQSVCAALYVGLIFLVVRSSWGNMVWAWSAEIVYWLLMFLLAYLFFKRPRWMMIKRVKNKNEALDEPGLLDS